MSTDEQPEKQSNPASSWSSPWIDANKEAVEFLTEKFTGTNCLSKSSTLLTDEERKDVPQAVQCCPWHVSLMPVIEIAYAWINDGAHRGKRVPYASIKCKCGAEKQAWGDPGDALEPLLAAVVKAWNR